MSEPSIPEVTRALRILLQSALESAVPGTVVTLHPPGELPRRPSVNLYLYHVSETIPRQPGVSLSYLITPFGGGDGEGDLLMLDTVMWTLRENPVLEVAGARINVTFRSLTVEELSRIVVPYRLSVAYDVRVAG